MEYALIIPSLNPDNRLIELVYKLNTFFNYIIIVDDGSKDECQKIFGLLKSNKVFIIHNEKNLGKGASIKKGIKFIYEKNNNINYVTADSDLQHSVEDIIKVKNVLNNNPSSLVLGVRNFKNKNVPFKSYYGNKISSFMFKIMTGKTCMDTQTGLRGISNNLTKIALETEGNRYEYEMNFLINVSKEKINFIYEPITTIYENNNTNSHFHVIRDSFLIYKNPLKFLLSSFMSFIFDLTLFKLFLSISIGIVYSSILARILSGIFNYLLNKKWTFKSKNKHFIKYGILFIIQMITSSLLVYVLSNILINILIIKILVDSLLFIISYFIQKHIVFKEV